MLVWKRCHQSNEQPLRSGSSLEGLPWRPRLTFFCPCWPRSWRWRRRCRPGPSCAAPATASAGTRVSCTPPNRPTATCAPAEYQNNRSFISVTYRGWISPTASFYSINCGTERRKFASSVYRVATSRNKLICHLVRLWWSLMSWA